MAMLNSQRVSIYGLYDSDGVIAAINLCVQQVGHCKFGAANLALSLKDKAAVDVVDVATNCIQFPLTTILHWWKHLQVIASTCMTVIACRTRTRWHSGIEPLGYPHFNWVVFKTPVDWRVYGLLLPVFYYPIYCALSQFIMETPTNQPVFLRTADGFLNHSARIAQCLADHHWLISLNQIEAKHAISIDMDLKKWWGWIQFKHVQTNLTQLSIQ